MEIASESSKNSDSAIDFSDDNVVTNLPSQDQILDQCNDLINEAKNFNLHAKILKRLLNLKERKNGYELYQRPKPSDCNGIEPKGEKSLFFDCGTLLNKMNDLRKEVEESHKLGFCLAYNIQCLQKRLTGTPIDVNSGSKLIQELQDKYDRSKTNDAIMKYEFQEKKKLLHRLRKQLEATREDWRNLRVRKRRPDSEEDVFFTEALKRDFARKPKQMSEESGFNESSKDIEKENSQDDPPESVPETGGLEAIALAMSDRKKRLDRLEDEYYNLFSSLADRTTDLIRRESDPIFVGELSEDLLDDEDVEDLSDPLIIEDEFDDVVDGNFTLNAVDPLEPFDNTEEADMSDLPWDLNLVSSRQGSNAGQTSASITSTVDALTQSERATAMMNSLLPSSDVEGDDEFTREDMESMAETGEPLVLCRLRRRAVEILISRLRDEKILQEKRGTELIDELEKLKSENEQLKNRWCFSKLMTNLFERHRGLLFTLITSLMVNASLITLLIR